MSESDDLIISPQSELSPGDVFPDVPFPLLKYPLKTYRPDRKAEREGKVQVFEADGHHKPGDIAHCVFSRQNAILLSHGCEIDKTLGNAERRHLLIAPIEQLASMSEELQSRIREGRQPNRFYLPTNSLLHNTEWCVDLRRILPVPAQYLIDASEQRLCSLTEVGQAALGAQLSVYFTGLAIYVEDSDCPHCGNHLTKSDFSITSEEEDTDYSLGFPGS